MAKCPICNARKGKRKCLAADGHICTLCCGQTRKDEICQSCSFYKPPGLMRKYKEIPSYTPKQMAESMELQEYSNAIEGAISAFDRKTEYKINDDVAIRVIELLLDKYHFKDEILTFDNELVEKGFFHVNKAIEDDLAEVHIEELIKVLGVIYFVAKRRSLGGREYLRIVNNYVGETIGPGFRVLHRL
jgi:hypothetical protein